MIVVEKLTKRYGSRLAVDDVSFEVERGEIVGFLGPNGAGKSTTLRMMTGFLAPSDGRVRIDGIDVHDEPVRAHAMFGYMPESVPLYGEMRVTEYLEYRSRLKGVSGKASRRDAERALSLAGVPDAAPRIIAHLSKGTRQRVALADALLADPPLLILDEPTAGLDPNQMRHVRDLIRSYAGKKTVFLSTHILPEVEASCERVIIVSRGKKVAEGHPSSLRARAAGRQMVRIVGKGATASFEPALEAIAGVQSVTAEAGVAADVTRWTVATEPGDEVVDAIFAAVVAHGLALRELTRDQLSLEDVFAEVTTDEPVESPEAP